MLNPKTHLHEVTIGFILFPESPLSKKCRYSVVNYSVHVSYIYSLVLGVLMCCCCLLSPFFVAGIPLLKYFGKG